MPCGWYKTADGTVMHINHGRGGGRKKLCPFCKRGAVSKLCDFPLGNGKTCDAEMCDGCARMLGHQDTEIGAGIKRLDDTIDVCPNHRTAAICSGDELRPQQQSLFGGTQ